MFCASVYATDLPYPVIRRLQLSDAVFRQLTETIALAYRAEQRASAWPDFFVAVYTTTVADDLFSLAARFNIPYETLATLNGLSNPAALSPGTQLLIPSIHGVFVPMVQRNDLDFLLMARNMEEITDLEHRVVEITVYAATGPLEFQFSPGRRFSSTERSFFLNPGFRLPVPDAVYTSAYGIRKSPIDGHYRKHNGIDLAAPAGTSVLAAKSGIVIEQGNNEVLGLYILLDHGAGIRTLYGHLSRVDTVLNQSVISGSIIGAVGSTGWSTGPHLHFEIQFGSVTRDPSEFIQGLSP
ncbi:MAG: M23 family metallopeptidase [Spirochaetes bacterium]|nr:M23 family metallopeptidase [Spirochaetota bacterium]